MCILRHKIAPDERIDTFDKIPNFCDFAIIFSQFEDFTTRKIPNCSGTGPIPLWGKKTLMYMYIHVYTCTFHAHVYSSILAHSCLFF